MARGAQIPAQWLSNDTQYDFCVGEDEADIIAAALPGSSADQWCPEQLTDAGGSPLAGLCMSEWYPRGGKRMLRSSAPFFRSLFVDEREQREGRFEAYPGVFEHMTVYEHSGRDLQAALPMAFYVGCAAARRHRHAGRVGMCGCGWAGAPRRSTPPLTYTLARAQRYNETDELNWFHTWTQRPEDGLTIHWREVRMPTAGRIVRAARHTTIAPRAICGHKSRVCPLPLPNRTPRTSPCALPLSL